MGSRYCTVLLGHPCGLGLVKFTAHAIVPNLVRSISLIFFGKQHVVNAAFSIPSLQRALAFIWPLDAVVCIKWNYSAAFMITRLSLF